MRRLAFLPWVFVIACGGDLGQKVVESEAAVEEPEGRSEDEEALESIEGMWENSSCGERKYLRRVNFMGDGTFTAVDEVAPCPPGAQCVWSGIIHWRGTWKKNDELIDIVPDFKKTNKTPETVPSGFIVLSHDPLSLGERSGDIVCPYQRN